MSEVCLLGQVPAEFRSILSGPSRSQATDKQGMERERQRDRNEGGREADGEK